MKMVLPFFDQPMASEYHISAFPLSILQAEKNFSVQYLLKKFIPISFDTTFPRCLSYKHRHFWYWNCFSLRLTLYPCCKQNRMKQKMIYCIQKGYYLSFNVNERYIDDRSANTANKDFTHDIMVYGYDDGADKFLVAGYTLSKKRYSQQSIEADSVVKGFVESSDFFHVIAKLKIKKRFNFFSKNKCSLKREIRKYFYSNSKHIGCNACKAFLQQTKKRLNAKSTLNMTSFRLIMERSNILVCLEKHFKLSSETSELLQQNQALGKELFFTALKWNISQKDSLTAPLYNSLALYFHNEQSILGEVYRLLKAY